MSNNQNKRDKLRRIVALIMVTFLLLSVFGSVIFYLITPVFAADNTLSADLDADGKLIRIGLMYGSNVTVGFETDAPYGFIINKVYRTGDLTNEPLWELDLTKVSCTVDANLSKSVMTYSKTTDTSATVIGGYHVEIGTELSREDTELLIDAMGETLSSLGIYAFPAYIDSGYRIRAGHFPSETIAGEYAVKVSELLGDIDVTVAKPTDTAVSLVDPLTDTVLFEYDCGDVTALGLTPQDSPDGERAYLVTPAKKQYDGTFMFRRYISGKIDGVSLTDVIPLSEYIKGVIPYEVNSSWHFEALKAFAIIVRSFTLAGTRHEKTYQVDLCNSTHCQVYGGISKITESVERAVNETAGMVMTYNNEIVYAYYSAVTGGSTVSSYDAWGYQHIPYLVAVETPWENYNNHSYGTWTAEVSPTELCTYLQSKGYASLNGAISSVTVDKLSEGSSYVRDITFTDIYGTKVSIKASANVYTALSKYVKSANFVVGKGQVKAERAQFHTVSLDSLKVNTSDGTYDFGTPETVTVISASGVHDAIPNESSVLTANGTYLLGGTTSVSETVTFYAEDDDNFIFVGKGWGHGVGASQIGLRDLAGLGYTAEDILPKYYTGVEIVNLRELE